MIKWLDTKMAIAYAGTVAETVVGLMPLEPNAYKPMSVPKRMEKFEKLLKQISSSEQLRKFNFYQRAKFGTVLKWDLRERGYSEDFVDDLVRFALTRLT